MNATATIITLRGKTSAGAREGLSGPIPVRALQKTGIRVVERLVLANERDALDEILAARADSESELGS